MRTIILFFIFILFINNTAMADCYTGFACSIEDLEKQEQLQTRKNINIFKKYLKKVKKPRKFVMLSNKDTEYSDLFVFIPIL